MHSPINMRFFALTVVVAATTLVTLTEVANADVWICRSRDGSVTMADRKLKGMRCKLFSKGPPASPVAAAPSLGGNDDAPKPAGSPSAWRPRSSGVSLRDEPAGQREREALYLPWIAQAAESFQLPIAFVRAVIRVESNFTARAESNRGAMGLMQIMPSVAREMGVSDPWEPRGNILGGTKLLRVLADRFDGDLIKVLSAYHAGSGAVKGADGIPWEATEAYVRRVLDHYYRYIDEAASAPPTDDTLEDDPQELAEEPLGDPQDE